MKTISFVFAALMMAACTHSETASETSNRNPSSQSRRWQSGTSSLYEPSYSSHLSGGSGMTMNDHDKLLEMCRSLNADQNCNDLVEQCSTQSSPQDCLRQHMK